MNAVLAVLYSVVPGFPAGSVVASISASITGTITPVVTQSVPPDTAGITFANVPADTYTFSVQGVDAAGNTFGTPVTGTFTISAPATVSLSLPATVSVTQT
jgi:hypothetical protein